MSVVLVCSALFSNKYFPSCFYPSVNLVKSKLDPESLGIILLGPFLLEFFPDQVGHMTNCHISCVRAYVLLTCVWSIT